MPRRNRKKGVTPGPGGEKGGPGENWGGEHMRQAPTPLVAVSPDGTLVAVAFGTELRVYDVSLDELAVLDSRCPADALDAAAAGLEKETTATVGTKQWHTDAIRAVRFCSTGQNMCTAGDDKKARVWRVGRATHDGKPRVLTCIKRASLQKKACATTFSADGKICAFADKFGDVHGLGTTETEEEVRGIEGEDRKEVPGTDNSTQQSVTENRENKPTYLFGHCCSIITDAVAPAGVANLMATADRDFKIRIAKLPSNANVALTEAIGVPEVQSFCHGHAAFVACLGVVPEQVSGDCGPLIVSGGGDGTARLWRCEDGTEMGSAVLAAPRETKGINDEEGEEDGEDSGAQGIAEGVAKGIAKGIVKGSAPDAVTTGEAPREAVDAPVVLSVSVGDDGTVFAAVEKRRGEVAELQIATDRVTNKPSLTHKGWLPLPQGLKGCVPSALVYCSASKSTWGVCAVKRRMSKQSDIDINIDGVEAELFTIGGAGVVSPKMKQSLAIQFELETNSAAVITLGDAMRKRSYDEQQKKDRKKQRNDFKKGGAS
eukprot:CAMPEP_0117636562 /NCGR_PEP_ID=MMETSP0802-20121206/6851_1 /TAXON_ID=38833 /ORGANISM="Micromonas sp., Strain CCMP2099" /LENGTH=543 /DNA_ID=CAMNT_0005441419 /DNA_START=56 /DNA_END=1684 /DNA_ORIENTATION=-